MICCMVGCKRNAETEMVGYTPDGRRFSLPVCKKDIGKGNTGRSAYRAGKYDDESSNVDPEKVIWKDPAAIAKLKESFAPSEAPASPAPQSPKEIIQVTEDWEYVEDYNRWRNAEGKVVKIKELENDELLDAMHLLKEFNFAKMGSTIIWMKGLPRKPGKYRYTKTAMEVGKDLALAKLEEMREVATERGLLGIST